MLLFPIALYIVISLSVCLFLAVLGFELRSLHWLGDPSTTSAMLPTQKDLVFFFCVFKTRSHYISQTDLKLEFLLASTSHVLELQM
jgi:hypothetical protein